LKPQQQELTKNALEIPNSKFKFSINMSTKVTLMCFVHDLFLFCKVDVRSVQLLFECFREFSQVYEFIANLGKSSKYFSGIKDGIQTTLE